MSQPHNLTDIQTSILAKVYAFLIELAEQAEQDQVTNKLEQPTTETDQPQIESNDD